jgi:hypothetical protein
MDRSKKRLTWAILAAVAMGGTGATAQDGPPLPKPSKEHQLLARDLGTWQATIRAWGDPNGEPEESQGTETNTLLPGGLWLLSRFEGKMMGMTFHGASQSGYDANKKKFVSTWVDSMSTSPMMMEGSYDEASRSLTLVGESVDPAGNKGKMRIVTTYKPDGGRLSRFYMTPGSGADETRMMEIEYARKAK